MAYVGNVAAFLAHLLINSKLSGTWNYVDTPIPEMADFVSTVRRKLGMGHGTGIRIPALLGIMGGFGFDMLSKLTHKKFPISRVRVRKFLSDSSFSAARIEQTGFIPPFDLQVSLDRVLKHEFPNRGGNNAK